LPDAIATVTDNPARATGLTDRGRIAPGLRADLVAVAPGDLEIAQFDVAAAVLDPRSRVTWVMVDGQVMIEQGEHATVDVRRVIADAHQARTDAGLH
jgi:cytosine/adenosine deaminase-related metal-dependent hydrolase